MNTLATGLSQRLFFDPGAQVYAVLDGASVPELRQKLFSLKPDHICLYRGEMSPDLAECAPYLIRLVPESEFVDWVLAQGWGRHWGVFAVAQAELKEMRKHFRSILRVKSPEGKVWYFRFYDPRVLRIYLATCTEPELSAVFGPIISYCLEDNESTRLIRFSRPNVKGKFLESEAHIVEMPADSPESNPTQPSL